MKQQKKNKNLIESKTINKYRSLLKYIKNRVFNDKNQKFKELNNILEYSKRYLINKRRMGEDSSSNQGINSNNNNDNSENNTDDDEEMEIGFDIMTGELSLKEDICLLEEDFGDYLKKLPIFKPIPIIELLVILLEPEVKLGFCISLEFESKLYDDIINTEKFFFEISNEEEEKEEEEDNGSKFSISVSGSGEVSLSAGAGIYLGDENTFIFGILAGIKGLLGSGEIGFSIEINFKEMEIDIDQFYVIQAFGISLFLKIEIKINIPLIGLKINIDIFIFDITLFGLKYEKHKTITKIIAKIIYENFIESNKNPLYLP